MVSLKQLRELYISGGVTKYNPSVPVESRRACSAKAHEGAYRGVTPHREWRAHNGKSGVWVHEHFFHLPLRDPGKKKVQHRAPSWMGKQVKLLGHAPRFTRGCHLRSISETRNLSTCLRAHRRHKALRLGYTPHVPQEGIVYRR